MSISLKKRRSRHPNPRAIFFLPRHPGAVPSSLWLFNPVTVFTTFLTFLPKGPPPLRLLDTPENIVLLQMMGTELINQPVALGILSRFPDWAPQVASCYSADFLHKLVFCLVLRINRLVSYTSHCMGQALMTQRQPSEILLHIFHFVSWSSTDMEWPPLPLLRLTWVCREWRYTAIRDMSLWSMVWFEDRFPYERSFTFIERAGTAPLDIRISERHGGWYEEHTNKLNGNPKDGHPFTAEMMRDVMDRLLPKIRTIRTLVVMVDTWEPALVVLNWLRDSYYVPERMERFELHQTGRPWLWAGPMPKPRDLSPPIPFCDNRTLPRLTYACLSGLHIRWSVPQMSNLYVLDIRRMPIDHCPSIHDFRDTLKASPRLSKLVLDAAGPQWVDPNVAGVNVPPTDLPYLATLVIGDFTATYTNYVLDTFTAKNLIDLTVLNMVGQDYGPLIEHLTGRFPDIRVMAMHSVQLLDSVPNKRRMIKWLQSMPKLEVLKIARLTKTLLQHFLEDANTWEEAMDLLTLKKPSIPLLPQLEILEYQCVAFDCASHFVEGRKKIGVALKKIYVSSPWFAQMKVEEKNWLAGIAQLCQLNPGAPNPEELQLRRVWTKTSGIPLPYLY